MAEALGFEAKVQGLIDYYRALEEIDPRNPQHSDVANPAVFYWSDHGVSCSLAEARQSLLFDMECHGRVEYGNRGFFTRDLREDTDELRAERADVLAVMTAPLTPELREQRTERIAGVLADIVAGRTIRITKYDNFYKRYKAPNDVAVDISRALFGVFTNGHVSSRVLTVQYDTPVHFAPTEDVKVGEPVLDIDVPALFKGNGLLLEPVAA